MAQIILWLLHIQYRKCKQPIFFIRGIGKDYPKYVLYTENPNVRERMERF